MHRSLFRSTSTTPSVEYVGTRHIQIRKSSTKKCFAFIIILTTLVYAYNEVYVYHDNYMNNLKCTGQCIKILLVADPQLIGLENEILHPITPLSIFDSDLYLSKTYNIVYNYVKPNVVIFLGDLFDEGSTATNEAYNSYLDRFNKIFSISQHTNKHIYLPGDNDIGGEGSESVSMEKVKKFAASFPQPDIIQYKNLSFYKINRILQSIPKVEKDFEFEQIDGARIVISHMPLIFQPSLFVDKVFKRIQPHLLFTAHEHKSMIVVMDGIVQSDRRIIPMTENKVYSNVLGISDVYEIIVPTCSYRMGTTKIGYGYAVIENGEFKYTVIWSPSRFHQILIYLIYLVLVIIVLIYCFIFKCIRRFKRSTLSNSYSVLTRSTTNTESTNT